MQGAASKPLTRDDCYELIESRTFRYRPSDYGDKFPKWPGSVGIELEMLPVVPGDGAPRPVKLQAALAGGALHSAAILGDLAKRRGWQTAVSPGADGRPLLMRVFPSAADNISFEPGGQVEFSSKPFPCLADALARTNEVQADLAAAYQERGIELVQIGLNPWHSLTELGLQMPKARYQAMDRYYSLIGPYGRRMMRQTSTVQINLDFGADANTLTKRYLAAVLVAPIAAGTFAYSSVLEGQAATHRGFRSEIWRHTDPTHTGVPGLQHIAANLNRSSCVESYLDFALNAQVVFVEGLDYLPAPGLTFAEWMQRPIRGVSPTMADFELHLSLLFPEVRPRGFLELRSIDCQSPSFQSVPASFYTGLLYSDRQLDRLLDLLLPTAGRTPDLLWRASNGLADQELQGLAKQVMGFAIEGFRQLPPCFKIRGSEQAIEYFHERFTSRGVTPADELLAAHQNDPAGFLSLAGLRRLEESWQQDLNS